MILDTINNEVGKILAEYPRVRDHISRPPTILDVQHLTSDQQLMLDQIHNDMIKV